MSTLLITEQSPSGLVGVVAQLKAGSVGFSVRHDGFCMTLDGAEITKTELHALALKELGTQGADSLCEDVVQALAAEAHFQGWSNIWRLILATKDN